MPRTHVPVLAGELIEALDPQPGQIAVDCTLGAAGHARLVADRLGAAGTLIAIDRDPLAEKAFAELAAEVAVRHPLHPRRLRARACALLAEEGVKADLGYLDLGMSSMQVDTRERGFSYAYDAPLDMRMDPDAGARPRARSSTPGTAAASRARCASTARSASPTGSPARSSAAAPARAPRSSSSTRSPPRSPRPRASPAAIPPSARSRRSGSPSTTSSPSSTRRCRSPGTSSRVGGRLAAISFHSLEDRRVKRFLAEKARGCICPPDLPVCGCGRTPEAEPSFRRSIVPTPGEVAANPRSKSARLRAARKLREER